MQSRQARLSLRPESRAAWQHAGAPEACSSRLGRIDQACDWSTHNQVVMMPCLQETPDLPNAQPQSSCDAPGQPCLPWTLHAHPAMCSSAADDKVCCPKNDDAAHKAADPVRSWPSICTPVVLLVPSGQWLHLTNPTTVPTSASVASALSAPPAAAEKNLSRGRASPRPCPQRTAESVRLLFRQGHGLARSSAVRVL